MEDQELLMLIARTCHQVNRAYAASLGDYSHLPWEEAPDWQKDSAIKGARMHMARDASVEDSHNAWMEEKVKDGWVYGATKNEVHKTHPCIRPYSELPVEQQAKDAIFREIVHSLRGSELLKSRADMRRYSDERTGFAEPDAADEAERA